MHIWLYAADVLSIGYFVFNTEFVHQKFGIRVIEADATAAQQCFEYFDV